MENNRELEITLALLIKLGVHVSPDACMHASRNFQFLTRLAGSLHCKASDSCRLPKLFT